MDKKELDYHYEAYVIVGMLENGKRMYYTYDYDKEHDADKYDFTFSVFDACLYNTLDEIDVFMKHIQHDKKRYSNIKSIHIEKFTTVKLENNHEMVL